MPERLSIAVWETHLAIEKAIKLYLRQRKVSVPKSHDLRRLKALAEATGAVHVGDDLFARVPSARDAIAYRYGEGGQMEVDHAMGIYAATLEIVCTYTNVLRRRLVMNNARIQIRVPPWKRRVGVRSPE
jgi:hypothetical protein